MGGKTGKRAHLAETLRKFDDGGFTSDYYNEADEYDTFEYDGKEYPIKYYGGYLFATEELADAMLNEDGEGKDSKARNMDERIAYYFDEDDFEGKTGKELYEEYNKNS